MNAQIHWRWEQGAVDERREHIELHYGNAENTPDEVWIPVARIAKPKNHLFVVEWLIDQDSPSNRIMVDYARRELDFFLVEHDIDVMSDHWDYAIYHCGTSGNMYSDIHWSYRTKGSQGEQQSSRIIELSENQSKRLFGTSKKSGKYIKGG